MPLVGHARRWFSSVIIMDGEGNYLQLPSLTTTQRDALSAVNGMMIYNSTTSQVESYTDGSWGGKDAYIRTDGSIPFTGDQSLGSHKLTDVTDPVSDQDVATKKFIEDKGFSKVIWKDASEEAYSESGRTSDLDWTDLDLTAYTSANATVAILRLKIIGTTIGTGMSSELKVRKNNTTPTQFPQLLVDKNYPENALRPNFVLVGLDSGQVIEYKIRVGTGWTVTTAIAVLGYIE